MGGGQHAPVVGESEIVVRGHVDHRLTVEDQLSAAHALDGLFGRCSGAHLVGRALQDCGDLAAWVAKRA